MFVCLIYVLVLYLMNDVWLCFLLSLFAFLENPQKPPGGIEGLPDDSCL